MTTKVDWKRIKSILFVPATPDRMVNISKIDADAFIIDLEDSIKEETKEQARHEVKLWLNDIKGNECALDSTDDQKVYPLIILRINKDRIQKESELFAKEAGISCIAIPKAESAEDIKKVISAFPDKDILVLIETPKGMINLDNMLYFREVNAVGFGGEDFMVAMGMKKNKDYLFTVKQQLLIYARAYEKEAYDMVEAEYKDKEKYEALAESSKDMGFTGKLAIHPNQTEVINKVFSDLGAEQIMRILSEYEKHNEGFLIIDGTIYEKPHIDRLRKILSDSRN